MLVVDNWRNVSALSVWLEGGSSFIASEQLSIVVAN
jgi:hypothetical protein